MLMSISHASFDVLPYATPCCLHADSLPRAAVISYAAMLP